MVPALSPSPDGLSGRRMHPSAVTSRRTANMRHVHVLQRFASLALCRPQTCGRQFQSLGASLQHHNRHTAARALATKTTSRSRVFRRATFTARARASTRLHTARRVGPRVAAVLGAEQDRGCSDGRREHTCAQPARRRPAWLAAHQLAHRRSARVPRAVPGARRSFGSVPDREAGQRKVRHSTITCCALVWCCAPLHLDDAPKKNRAQA